MTGTIYSEHSDLALTHTHPDTGVSIGYGVGVDGYNRGIYDNRNGRWAVILNTNNYLTLIGEKIQLQPMSVGTAYKPYYEAGDSYTESIVTAGWVTSSGVSLRFSIPLCKPVIGSPSVTVLGTIIVRQDATYQYGSGASTTVTPSTWSATLRTNCIYVRAEFDSAASSNNSPAGVDAFLTVTFS